MTHILLDIKYDETLPLLYEKSIGEKIIYDWCNYNNHDLVMPPISYVFPSISIYNKTKHNKTKNNKTKNNKTKNEVNIDYNSNISQTYSAISDYENSVEYSGYTSFGLLKESHISIHTYPELNSIQLDFFSCKVLDKEHNVMFVEKKFHKNSAIKFNFKFLHRAIN
uniref:S-Adenosylmethionine Decarboxylase n=1 Tax=Florenciella sp. virus SA2 TaxID=3240092 RepID=A0AB39JB56_9VIRU